MSNQDHIERSDFAQASPTLFKKFLDFTMAIGQESAIEPEILHLVDIRASQLNGCAFCLDMHVKQATIHNMRPLRMYHIAIWRESPLFNLRERAALAWTEALTKAVQGGVPDAVYERVREQFTEKELVELTYQVMAINGWNRINVAFQAIPGSKDKAYGLTKAGLS
jgi:AhpD family alkylhydroperoxidase